MSRSQRNSGMSLGDAMRTVCALVVIGTLLMLAYVAIVLW